MTYQAETSDGVVTSFIALTTPFPMPQSCSSKFRAGGFSLLAFDPAYGLDVEATVTCGPPAVTTWWNQGLLGVSGDGHTAVSLGPLTCPDGWQTVQTYEKDASSTQVMCCPSQYVLANEISAEGLGEVNGNCLSRVPAGAVLTYGSTAAINSNSWRLATTTVQEATTVGAIAIVGWNIEGRAVPSATGSQAGLVTTNLQNSYRETGTLQSPPSETGAGDNSIDPASPSTSKPSSSPNTAPSSGMSTGVKAGIGVGVAVGAIGIIALIVALFILLRRRKAPASEEHRSSIPTDRKDEPSMTQDPREWRHFDSHDRQQRQELDSTHFHELAHNSSLREMSATPKASNTPRFRSPIELSDSNTRFPD